MHLSTPPPQAVQAAIRSCSSMHHEAGTQSTGRGTRKCINLFMCCQFPCFPCNRPSQEVSKPSWMQSAFTRTGKVSIRKPEKKISESKWVTSARIAPKAVRVLGFFLAALFSFLHNISDGCHWCCLQGTVGRDLSLQIYPRFCCEPLDDGLLKHAGEKAEGKPMARMFTRRHRRSIRLQVS